MKPSAHLPQKLRLLIADDEPYITWTLSVRVSDAFEPLTANSFEAAQACFARGPIDVLLTDPLHRTPAREATGFQLLEWVRIYSPETVRLFMTADMGLLLDELPARVESGLIYGYIEKPWTTEGLLEFLHDATAQKPDRPYVVES